MEGGRYLPIVRCSQCYYAIPFGDEEEEKCSRYHKVCPPHGIPDWCRLRRAKVKNGKAKNAIF